MSTVTITFTDATGAATLQSSWPAPANRFCSWRPSAPSIGEPAHALGTGMRYQWSHRVDYRASFEIRGVANSDLDIAMRLQAHLEKGGTCAVNTGDAGTRSYPTCCLAPDGAVQIDGPTNRRLDYTVRLDLLNVAATPVAMECIY